MKRWFFFFACALFVLFPLRVHCQSDSMVHVKEFPGGDVGTKISNAMATCNTAGGIPCILVVDASLAALPAGTMPRLCANCYLADYRHGNPLIGTAVLAVKNFASMGPRYDVTQFGAVGNGTTDDTAAIQAAFTACYDGGGGTVELPGAHTYLVSGTIYAYDTCRLEGQVGLATTSPGSLSPVQIYWDGPNTKTSTASVSSVTVVNNRTQTKPLVTAMEPGNRPSTQLALYQLQVTAANTFAANQWVEFSGCTYQGLNNVIAQVASANSNSFTAVFNSQLTAGTYSSETCTATRATVIFAFDSVEHETDSVTNVEFGDHVTGGVYNTPEGVDLYYSGRIDSGNNLSRVWFESPHYFGVYFADGGENGKIEEGSRGDGSDYYQVYWRVGGTDRLTVVDSQFGPGAPSTRGAPSAGGGFLLDNASCNGGAMTFSTDHLVTENDANMTPGLADVTMIQCPTSVVIPQFRVAMRSSGLAAPSSVTGVTILQVSPASDLAASLDLTSSQISTASNTTNAIVGIPYVSLYAQLGMTGLFSDFHYFPSLQSWGINSGALATYNQPAQILGDLYLENLFQFSVPGSLWLNSDAGFAALSSGTTLAEGTVLAPPAYFDCGTGSSCSRYAVDVVQSPGTTGTLNGGATTCTGTSGQSTITCSSGTGLMVGQYITTPAGKTRITRVNLASPSAVVVSLAAKQSNYANQAISYAAPVLGSEIQLPTKASAAPTRGTWKAGDIVENSTAATGGACLWVYGADGKWHTVPCGN